MRRSATPVPVPLSLLTKAPPRGDAFNVRGCYSTAMVMAAGDAPAFRKLT
jgi:hypothetical protein